MAPRAHDDYDCVATGGSTVELRATNDLVTISVRAHCRVSALTKDGSAKVRECNEEGKRLRGRQVPIKLLLPPNEEIKA